MNTVVLFRKLDGNPSNGFERYAHNLVEGLSRLSVDVKLINQNTFFDVKPSGTMVSPFYYDFIRPFWEIIRGRAGGDVIHALTDSQAVMFPLMKGKKIVTMHHVDKTPPIGIKEKIFRSFYTLGTEMGIKYADAIICISDQTRQEVLEAYNVDENKLVVIPHAVSEDFCIMPEAEKKDIVGYVGALKNRKNLEFLIRTAAEYRKMYPDEKTKFQICGEGPEKERLLELTKNLDVSDLVEFKGLIADEELVPTYNSFSLFCIPSLQEGFGFPIIEAERCGIPVLTLKGAMIPEEVVTAATKCSDEKEMAQTIHNFLTDKTIYSEAVEKALEHSSAYSIDKMCESTEKLYEKVLRA